MDAWDEQETVFYLREYDTLLAVTAGVIERVLAWPGWRSPQWRAWQAMRKIEPPPPAA